MHQTVRDLDHPDFYVSALLARWRAATATLRWVNCGHPPAYVVDVKGELDELGGASHPSFGVGEQERSFRISERQLHAGERLILVTDGIMSRQMEGGGTFGLDGLRTAVASAAHPTAAVTAMAIQQAVTQCWKEPLDDDATVVVMSVE